MGIFTIAFLYVTVGAALGCACCHCSLYGYLECSVRRGAVYVTVRGTIPQACLDPPLSLCCSVVGWL
jgi:hypothetical protein